MLELKLSKYTLYTVDEQKNYIIHNTFVGSQSTCIISARHANSFRDFVIKGIPLDSRLENYLEGKNIIIEDEIDEETQLRALYLKSISDNVLNIVILPTEKCNFRCKYCYETFVIDKMNTNVQQSIIAFVKKKIHKYNGLRVMWFGGEPLLECGIIENLSEAFIDICNKNRKWYTAQITTNAYLLTPAVFQKLLQFRIVEYQITLDGIKTIHNSMRILKGGLGTYDVIVQNLLGIKERFPRNTFRIVVRTNLTKQIMNHVDEYIETCNMITNHDNRFLIDIQFVNNWQDVAAATMKDEIVTQDDILIFMHKLYENECALKNIYMEDLQPSGVVCPTARVNSFLVRSNGAIHKCTMGFENPDTLVGNICDKKEIVENRYNKWLCQWDYCGKLTECKFAPVCFGDSCPAQRLLLPNDQYSCPRIFELAEVYLKLLAKNGQIKDVYS